MRLARAALPCAQSCRCDVPLQAPLTHLCSVAHVQVVDVLAAGGVMCSLLTGSITLMNLNLLPQPVEQVVDVLAAGGVKFIAMRCAGFDRVRVVGGWMSEALASCCNAHLPVSFMTCPAPLPQAGWGAAGMQLRVAMPSACSCGWHLASTSSLQACCKFAAGGPVRCAHLRSTLAVPHTLRMLTLR